MQLDDRDHEQIVADLATRYEGQFTREEVEAAVRRSRAHLEPNATIPDFLPVFVRRFARDELVHLAEERGLDPHGLHDVLFVCNGNAGRSQMAAAFANQLGAGRVRAWSAGINPMGQVLPDVVEAMREVGIDLAESYPKPVTGSATRAAETIVAIGVPPEQLPEQGAHLLEWDIAPVIGQGLETTRATRDEIRARVEELVEAISPSAPRT
ncbi:arsenate reductase ArsC [Desertihabitans brevis]|uniref:Arsenate reductase ArsC n=1 Tax=Desertihabitans brevis TaxID=2268447 RepID=A0A367YRU7_9ACTN|nr:arsenate reductase ArsC [Desertihabitans brevis]RCK68564.1 arsenate reductase ArsC [Desertihabitans brevis]